MRDSLIYLFIYLFINLFIYKHNAGFARLTEGIVGKTKLIFPHSISCWRSQNRSLSVSILYINFFPFRPIGLGLTRLPTLSSFCRKSTSLRKRKEWKTEAGDWDLYYGELNYSSTQLFYTKSHRLTSQTYVTLSCKCNVTAKGWRWRCGRVFRFVILYYTRELTLAHRVQDSFT